MGGNPNSRTRLGAHLFDDGSATFSVWAPFADAVWLTGDFNDWSRDATPLTRDADGNWSVDIANAAAGQEYKYIIRHGDALLERNDPRALQLTSSADSSVLVSQKYDWQGDDFTMPGREELVIYELHVGTFAREDPSIAGTFVSAQTKLDYLQQLGINAIEIMPISAAWMDRWWGYTPDNMYAVESSYGGRKALLDFVRAAHQKGIGVILDVVYNHLSQDAGLDLWQFDGWHENNLGGIYFYNDWRSHTPWGESRPDYGRPEVRSYITDNAAMWLRDCRVDGLRIDSTLYMRNVEGKNNNPDHDIPDAWKMLQEITQTAQDVKPGAIMIAEDLQGNPWITKSQSDGGAGFDSQWDPSFAAIMREVLGPIKDEDRSMEKIRVALTMRTNDNPFERVIYSESHDTDAHANGGTRLDEVIEPGNAGGLFARRRSALAAALLMTTPGVPMLFQGQEFQEPGAFSHYTSLDWTLVDTYAGMVDLYKHLIALRLNRHGNTAGLLGGFVEVAVCDESQKVVVFRRWDKGGVGDDVVVVANFSNDKRTVSAAFPAGGTWRARLSTDWKGYSGDFTDVTPDAVDAQKKGDTFVAGVEIAPYSVLIFSQD